MAKKTIIGNWKMNGTRAFARELVPAITSFAAQIGSQADIVICPPATLLADVEKLVQGSFLAVGAQDCSAATSGAFTGELSAEMLKDVGCRYALVGHSERRANHGESDALVAEKAKKLIENGIIPVICVGETLSEREAGEHNAVVAAQVLASLPQLPNAHFLLAYEPVWAIGSGKIPAMHDIESMHSHIISVCAGSCVLYGGSVNAANAAEILALPSVAGVLVGGASLKKEEFCGIIAAAEVS